MNAVPLRWDDGALLILDQRALPGEESWIRCESPAEVADCIRSLAVRGAPAIGIAAVYAMALAARRAEDPDAAAATLRATRPTAVNLGWALDRALAPDGADPLELARRIHAEQLEADRRLAELGAQRFRPGDRALTHCNAGALATGGYGTAGGVLRAAWEAGRLAQVWVDETRPLLQGARLTAWELRQAGIPHRVVADSAAGSLLAAGVVDRIVVGADRIAANGDVANKIGTYPLAVLAARHGVPFYVAAPVSTIDAATPSGAAIPIEEREMLRLGLVTSSSGNVSGRAGERIEITPSGLAYDHMSEADLVTLAADGSVVGGAREPSSERRVHVAIYAARPDAHAVVHTHSVHATAWSLLGEPLETGTEELEAQVGGAVRTAPFAPSGSHEVAELCVSALAGRGAALLAGHGVVALGDSPADALVRCQCVERQAQIAWLLRGARAP